MKALPKSSFSESPCNCKKNVSETSPYEDRLKTKTWKLFQANVSLVEVADVVHHLEGKLEILSSHISCQIPDSCCHVNGGSRSKKQKIFHHEGKRNR